MPYYRLVDQETGESVALRRMSHDAANLLNAELGDDQQWKRGLQHEKTSSPPIGTLHQITRSLDTEGFNQHSLQVIERFLNRDVPEGDRPAVSVGEAGADAMFTGRHGDHHPVRVSDPHGGHCLLPWMASRIPLIRWWFCTVCCHEGLAIKALLRRLMGHVS